MPVCKFVLFVPNFQQTRSLSVSNLLLLLCIFYYLFLFVCSIGSDSTKYSYHIQGCYILKKVCILADPLDI
jgi:hypothetical protein